MNVFEKYGYTCKKVSFVSLFSLVSVKIWYNGGMKEVKNMNALIKDVELTPLEETEIKSNRTKDFIKWSKLIEEAEKEKERIYMQLSEDEKEEAFRALQKQHNIPGYLTVYDVAEILDVSVQMVRRYCSNGTIKAEQRLKGSGKWHIKTKQFMDNKNWGEFVKKRAEIKEKSLKLAQKMIEILDEEETKE